MLVCEPRSETSNEELNWIVEHQKAEIRKLQDDLKELEGENEILRDCIFKMAVDRYCN